MNSHILNKPNYILSLIVFVFCAYNSIAQNCNLTAPSVHVNFNVCHAFLDGSYADYSEFTAISNPNSSCGAISLIGGHPYRNNGSTNSHSCAPGYNSAKALCISSLDNCTYIPAHDRSLIFDILIEPGQLSFESLDSFSFYSLSSSNFQFIDGDSGLNNYPTKMGIRVLKNNIEIFNESNIETSQEWTHYGFSFKSLPEATVEVPTLFRIEVLPYCLIGNESNVSAWEIDDAKVFTGCTIMGFDDFDAGQITIPASSDFCINDSPIISFENSTVIGENIFWLVTDDSGDIVQINDSGNINFSGLPSQNYQIYVIVNEEEIISFNGSQNINNLSGCFNLSAPLNISIDNPRGGTLGLTSGEDKITILAGLIGDVVFETTLDNSSGSNSIYILVNESRIIDLVQNSNVFDFSEFELGIYEIYHVSSFEPLSSVTVGQDLTSISECIDLSTGLIVEIINCLREDLDDNGAVANNDFLIFTSFLNKPCSSPCRPDFNDDGIVDNADFLSFVTKFNDICN